MKTFEVSFVHNKDLPVIFRRKKDNYVYLDLYAKSIRDVTLYEIKFINYLSRDENFSIGGSGRFFYGNDNKYVYQFLGKSTVT